MDASTIAPVSQNYLINQTSVNPEAFKEFARILNKVKPLPEEVVADKWIRETEYQTHLNLKSLADLDTIRTQLGAKDYENFMTILTTVMWDYGQDAIEVTPEMARAINAYLRPNYIAIAGGFDSTFDWIDSRFPSEMRREKDPKDIYVYQHSCRQQVKGTSSCWDKLSVSDGKISVSTTYGHTMPTHQQDVEEFRRKLALLTLATGDILVSPQPFTILVAALFGFGQTNMTEPTALMIIEILKLREKMGLAPQPAA